MCGVPYHSAETYIERLINKGYKVAICEQVEDPSQAKGVVRREVVRVITPGTVIEEQMLEEKENNFLVVLAGDGHRSALAACDLSTGECHITQLEGAEDLLDEAATYHPREVLISGALARDKAFVKQSSTRLGSVVTPVDEEELPPLAEMERQLREQFPEDWSLLTSPELTWAAGVSFRILRRTQKRTLRHLHRLHRYDVRRYMMLDDSARRNLELTTTIRGGKKAGFPPVASGPDRHGDGKPDAEKVAGQAPVGFEGNTGAAGCGGGLCRGSDPSGGGSHPVKGDLRPGADFRAHRLRFRQRAGSPFPVPFPAGGSFPEGETGAKREARARVPGGAHGSLRRCGPPGGGSHRGRSPRHRQGRRRDPGRVRFRAG